MEGGAVGHNFEREPPKDHPSQISFNLVQWFQRRRFKCDLLSKYFKMAAVTKNRNFFNCPLLLYYKSK
jgi:hypothetical protein